MRIELFGGFSIKSSDGESIALGTRKDQALLAYLILNQGRGHTRAKLAALLWGDRIEQQARASLSQSLYGLRAALHKIEGCRVESRLDQVSLEPGTLSIDVCEFQQAFKSGEPERLKAAVLAIRGAFLDGFDLREEAFEEWLRVEREALRLQIVQACKQLLADYEMRLPEKQTIALRRLAKSMSTDELDLPICRTTDEVLTKRRYSRLLPSRGVRPTLAVTALRTEGPVRNFGPMTEMRSELVSAFHRSRSVAVKVDRDCGLTHPEALSDLILNTRIAQAGDDLRLTVRVFDADIGTVLFNAVTAIERERWPDWPEWAARTVGQFESAFSAYMSEKAWSLAQTEFEPGEEVFRGFALMDEVTALGRWRAFRRFSKAYSARPGFARALVCAAWCYKRLMQESGNVLSSRSRARVLELVRQALQADSKDPFVLAQASGIYLRLHASPSRAIELLDQAILLHPGWTRIWSASAETYWMLGRPDTAIESAERALDLVPEDPSFWVPHAALAISEMQRGNYDEAVLWANRSLDRNPALGSVKLARIACEALRGRVQEARRLVHDEWRSTPIPTFAHVRSHYQLGRLQNLDKVMNGLEGAGLLNE